jgi:hypothetical protein
LEGFAKRMLGLCAERRGAKTAAQELAMETAEARTKCPGCDNDVVIERNWTPGGVNDSGGYVLQCEKCDRIFAFHLGKDINDSRVLRGAKKLDTYDDELGNKDTVLGKYGL